MSQILNRILKVSLKLSILLLSYINCFAQHTVKHTVNNGVSAAETSEYYIYNRSDDQYNAISFKLCMSKSGVQANSFKLNLVYTTTLQQVPQKMVFWSASDSSVSITSNLTPTGTKLIDNKKLTSNLYSINVTDSLKTFLAHQQIKKISLIAASEQIICWLDMTEPRFLAQQFNSVQAPVKRKPVIKKTPKRSS